LVERLGADYEIPLVSVLIGWYRAMRASVAGEPAEAAYRAAAARLAGTGMSGLSDGILELALLCDRVQRGAPGDFGVYEPDGIVPPTPRDLLYEVRTCLHALTAIRRGDRSTMADLYTSLEPAANELAGAGSGLLTLRPVAYYLGELATALGRDAAGHYRKAEEVARRAGATHWLP
jgi:hypothetical protein